MMRSFGLPLLDRALFTVLYFMIEKMSGDRKLLHFSRISKDSSDKWNDYEHKCAV